MTKNHTTYVCEFQLLPEHNTRESCMTFFFPVLQQSFSARKMGNGGAPLRKLLLPLASSGTTPKLEEMHHWCHRRGILLRTGLWRRGRDPGREAQDVAETHLRLPALRNGGKNTYLFWRRYQVHPSVSRHYVTLPQLSTPLPVRLTLEAIS